MIVPDHRMPTPSLAGLDLGDIVEIRVILFDLVRSHCWGMNIAVGDVVQCLGTKNGHVLVARADGSRTSVPEECAAFIGVEPFELFESPSEVEALRPRPRARKPRAPGRTQRSPRTTTPRA